MTSVQKKLIGLCILLISLLVNAQQKEWPKSLFWEVSGNGLARPSYLLGTFHLMCKEQVKLGAVIQKKLDQTHQVFFEVDLSNPAAMMQSLTTMNMKEGKKLKDLLTEADYRKVDSVFSNELKLSLSLFGRMKPYLLSTLLYSKFMKCSQQSGIDLELMNMAKRSGKTIKGLETLEYQASLFDSIPYELQAKELVKMSDSLDSMKTAFTAMIAAYLSQDIEQIARMSTQNEIEGSRFNTLLLTNRNKNWVDQLEPIMKNQSLFIAVGAGHLPGEEGLIALLRNAGYKVKPIRGALL